MTLLDTIQILVYIWALGEVATTAHLYLYSYQKGTKSVILRALFLFLLAVALSLFCRLTYAYTTLILGEHSETIRHLMIIPNVLIILTARLFRDESTKLDK